MYSLYIKCKPQVVHLYYYLIQLPLETVKCLGDLFYYCRRYYKAQNSLIETYEEIHSSIEEDAQPNDYDEHDTTKLVSIMSKVTFGINFVSQRPIIITVARSPSQVSNVTR